MKSSFVTLQQLGLCSLLATVALSQDDPVMPECWKKCVHRISTGCQSPAVDQDCSYMHTFSSFSAQRVLLGLLFRMSCFSLLVIGLCEFEDNIDHGVFECLDAECEEPSDVADFRGLVDECKFERWSSSSTRSIAATATRTSVISEETTSEIAITSTVRVSAKSVATMDNSDAGSGMFSKKSIRLRTRL